MLEKKDERRRVWQMSTSNCKGGGEVQDVKGEGFVLRAEHLRTVRAWRGGGGQGEEVQRVGGGGRLVQGDEH